MRLRFVVAVFAVAIGCAAPAAAVPGDPNPGCESIFGGVLICDGPIRPDGMWKRCSQKPALYAPPVGNAPGGFAPGGTVCAVVGPGSIPWDTPQYHIGD